MYICENIMFWSASWWLFSYFLGGLGRCLGGLLGVSWGVLGGSWGVLGGSWGGLGGSWVQRPAATPPIAPPKGRAS